MRALIAIFLGYCTAVSANPRVIHPSDLRKGVYIASEHLVVSVTSSNARVRGTFTFDSGLTRKQLGQAKPVRLLVPLWFPEENTEDSSVAKFWKTFPKGGWNEVTDSDRGVLNEVLGLKVEIGQELAKIAELAVLRTDSFGAATNREWGAFRFVREPGFCCVVFEVLHSTDFVRNQTPVTISYNAPLFRKGGDGIFVYTPVFDPIPKGLSTLNTNRYAITIAAGPDCSLTWSSGARREPVESGKSITFAPKGWDPFRVTVRSRANERSGVDAGTALCLHMLRCWPGATHRERSAPSRA
jgi:hypothetical protein